MFQIIVIGLTGGTSSGNRVTNTQQCRCQRIYSCVRILSETVASLPIHVYEYTELGSTKAIKHPLYRILHDEPNTEMTSYIFRETLMTHLFIMGKCLCTNYKKW